MVHRLTFLGTLIYASIMYHRQRKSSRYDLLSKGQDVHVPPVDVPPTDVPPTDVRPTDQPQQYDPIVTNNNSQDRKSTYEMYPPAYGSYEALSEPILEIMTSDTIAELPTTRD
jgi:hypothetical protein